MHHFCLVTRIGKGSPHESLNVWVSALEENTYVTQGHNTCTQKIRQTVGVCP